MKPYSKDLRLRVLAAVDSGVPREEVAKTFSVSVPTIKRWQKRRREAGDIEPKPIPGRPRLKGAALEEWLPSQLQANDDLTLQEHREAFEEQTGVVVSASTVSRAIERLPGGPWPIKKVEGGPRTRRGGKMPVALALASHFDARRLVFLRTRADFTPP
jgi:transposase